MISAKPETIPTKMSIEQILKQRFIDNDQPILLLRTHNLEGFFNNCIRIVKEEIEKQPIDFVKFREIASSVLISVNSTLQQIKDPKEKGYLEVIVAEVADYLLTRIIKPNRISPQLINEIIAALQTTSELKGYNFEALVAL